MIENDLKDTLEKAFVALEGNSKESIIGLEIDDFNIEDGICYMDLGYQVDDRKEDQNLQSQAILDTANSVLKEAGFKIEQTSEHAERMDAYPNGYAYYTQCIEVEKEEIND